MFDEYEFWLLDLDGTILDVERSYVRHTMSAVARLLDTSFTTAEMDHIWYGRTGLRNDILRSNGVDPVAFWDAFHRIESPQTRAAASKLHADAEAVCDLAGPRGVVTHCQSYLTGPVLDRLDIRDWFDTIVCCSDDLGWKPDPAPVECAIESLAVEGKRGVLVGDSAADVEAAHNAGLDSVLIVRDGPVPAIEPDYTVDSLRSLV